LHEREVAGTQLQQDFHKAATDLRLADEQLKASAEMSRQFQESLQLFERAKQAFQRTEQQLASRLEAASKTLGETEASLQRETSERQKLTDVTERLQLRLQQQTEKSALELSRLQSALETEKLERKQLEGTAIHARYASIESARADRVLLARLRGRMREPIEELLRSARHLIEDELQPARRKVVESVLEQALLLKSNFQEASSAGEPPLAPAATQPPAS
jgi:hypothetical protein